MRVEHTLASTGIQNQALHVRYALAPICERSKILAALIAAAQGYVGSMYLAHAEEHVIPSPPPHYFPKQCQLISLCKHGKLLHRKLICPRSIYRIHRRGDDARRVQIAGLLFAVVLTYS